MVRDDHRRRKTVVQLAAALAVLGAGFFVGQAPALAATDGFFVEGRQLFSIDLETGTSEAIGTTGVDEVFSSLAFGPDGTLYSIADARVLRGTDEGIEPAELYTIDVGTGAATLVGMLTLNNDTGMFIGLTSLTFGADGTALMSGMAPGDLETVFAVDVDGASNGLVPVSRLTSTSGFLTLASDTACDGTIFGLSVELPDRSTQQPGRATLDTLPAPGQVSGVPSAEVSSVRAQPAPPGVPPVQTREDAEDDDALPMVLTTIDPATGTTTEVGPTGLGANEFTIPGIGIDRSDGTLWGEVLDGSVFTIDDGSGAADDSAGTTANDISGVRRPQNLAISPVSCSQPTTTTTSSTTTTSTTTTTVATPPAPPPARPATPVPAQPSFTG